MAQPLPDLLWTILLFTGGAGLMVFAGRIRRRAERIHAERLAQLDAGGEESFFEERRSLEAYPPARHDRTWRLLGAVLLLFAGLQIYQLLSE